MCVCRPAARAETPSTQPQAAPATQPAPTLARRAADESTAAAARRWLKDLADPDPAVRDHARVALMGLHREDLPILRDVVAAEQPLLPGQITALRDVVEQVFMSGEDYAPASGRPFLGLRWEPSLADEASTAPGVIVEERIPGFTAYRMLENGDIILKILNKPEVDCRFRGQFVAAVATMSPGETMRLRVLRRGKIQVISVRLEPAPEEILANPTDYETWVYRREQKAVDYWHKELAPLLDVQASAG